MISRSQRSAPASLRGFASPTESAADAAATRFAAAVMQSARTTSGAREAAASSPSARDDRRPYYVRGVPAAR
jgi:hypothetical protein